MISQLYKREQSAAAPTGTAFSRNSSHRL